MSNPVLGKTFVNAATGEPEYVHSNNWASFGAVKPENGGPITQTRVNLVSGVDLVLECTPQAFNEALAGN